MFLVSRWEILATKDPDKTLGQRHIEAVRKYFLDKGEEPRTCSVEGCDREVLVIKNPDGETVEFDKCIFHVDKENEYWIENYYRDDYESYKKRRDEAIEKEEPFDEDFQIEWNEKLVAQFWELIREFKDIVFDESDTYRKWGILVSIANSYNFSRFVFPKFENIETESDDNTDNVDNESSDSSNIESSLKKDSNFWTTSEGLIFRRQVYFENSTFVDEAKFNGIKFEKEAIFSNSKFFNIVAFTESTFMGNLLFEKAIFLNKTDFENVKVSETEEAIFSESKFFNNSTFERCKMNSSFAKCLFLGEANFNNSKFIRKSDFSLAKFKKKANFKRALFIKIDTDKVNFNNTYFFEETDLDSLNFKGNNIEIDFSDMYSVYPISISLSITGSGSLLFKVPSHYNLLILYNSNLSRFNDICFDGDVENVKFLNINWGKIDGKRFCKDEENRKKRDIFRQIKLALDKQENYIDARKFYALEMWAYGEELKSLLQENQEENSITWKDKLSLYTDIAVYKFYELTSNFGLSWIKPLSFLILFAFLYMVLLKFKFIFSVIPVLLWKSGFYSYTLLIAPIDLLNKFARTIIPIIPGIASMQKEIEGFEFITLLYYSFSAYLIYQFVMAIRRKVRR